MLYIMYVLYCMSLSYWQKRISTTLQKLNAIVLLKQRKNYLFQKLGLVSHGDLNLLMIV